MLLRAHIDDKTIGSKHLLAGFDLVIEDGEKIGLIGRNGVGKTTLFGVLDGSDKDYQGEVVRRRGLSVTSTAQEHHAVGNVSCLDYIMTNLPEYAQLHQQIDKLAGSSNMDKITEYTAAVERFSQLGYYDVEEKVIAALADYQIDEDLARGPLAKSSGGQKRFVELVKVTQADCDLALIDEPTNHMDYVAKLRFISWLEKTNMGVVVITHDRDVLKQVDRIIEIKDMQAFSFKGNYDAYLAQNSQQTVQDIGQYEVAQRTIANIKKQIAYARSKKASWTGTADKKNPFVVMEERLKKQLAELEANVGRPSFWIDQESVDQLDDKVVERYDKYKAKNIRIGAQSQVHRGYLPLVNIKNLSLGYEQPLFDDVSFEIGAGQRVQLRGRNGAGKTTLIKSLRQALGQKIETPQTFAGSIEPGKKLKLGVYEQEIDPDYLDMKLGDAVMAMYRHHNLPLSEQEARKALANYLFNPVDDFYIPIKKLSGGQRARFQLISMLAHKPDLLILDEPTNHLDLPSIEELENALKRYEGGILYVSHDSYFTESLGGQVVQIGPN